MGSTSPLLSAESSRPDPGRRPNRAAQAVRNGLVLMLPVVLLGSFALVFRSFPLAAWQAWLAESLGGALPQLLTFVHNATFGLLSVYLTLLISLSYVQAEDHADQYLPQAPITSLICFIMLLGFETEQFPLAYLGIQGMFTAIFSAVVSSACMVFLHSKRHQPLFYTEGSDASFNNAVRAVLPSFLTIGLFALGNLALVRLFHVTGFQELVVRAAGGAFGNMGPSLLSALLYAFMTNLLWFFGMHGTNVLESAFQHVFSPVAGVAALTEGGSPGLFSKSFFDVFVAMGGSGSTLGLLLAIFLFSRTRSSRGLGVVALLPMLFNINELLVFGLPIVFNVHLLIPFLVVPLAITLTTWAAMRLGLVPPALHDVAWTTPILLGGYAATHSVAGSLLQVFNLGLGMLLYRPFLLRYDRSKMREAAWRMRALTDCLLERQEQGVTVDLLGIQGSLGTLAKMLAGDLRSALRHGGLELYHQPQYDNHNQCIGSEALLRWKHPTFGFVAPPLIVRLAEESGLLDELERWVVTEAGRHAAALREQGLPFQTCVNVTVPTLYSEGFPPFLQAQLDGGTFRAGDIRLEVTEQTSLLFTEDSAGRLKQYRAMGLSLVIDDFSMGHTSLKYLQDNEFDMVKLDGSLVRDLDNSRCREIIASIVSLAGALHFDVLAEFVETEEQRRTLESIGVKLYQGYLYSPAVPFAEFISGAGNIRR